MKVLLLCLTMAAVALAMPVADTQPEDLKVLPAITDGKDPVIAPKTSDEVKAVPDVPKVEEKKQETTNAEEKSVEKKPEPEPAPKLASVEPSKAEENKAKVQEVAAEMTKKSGEPEKVAAPASLANDDVIPKSEKKIDLPAIVGKAADEKKEALTLAAPSTAIKPKENIEEGPTVTPVKRQTEEESVKAVSEPKPEVKSAAPGQVQQISNVESPKVEPVKNGDIAEQKSADPTAVGKPEKPIAPASVAAPLKEEPAKEEPAKEEPAKKEPAKEEPAKKEPAKEESQAKVKALEAVPAEPKPVAPAAKVAQPDTLEKAAEEKSGEKKPEQKKEETKPEQKAEEKISPAAVKPEEQKEKPSGDAPKNSSEESDEMVSAEKKESGSLEKDSSEESSAETPAASAKP